MCPLITFRMKTVHPLVGLCLLLIVGLCAHASERPDIKLADFESGDLSGWTMQGDAFTVERAPVRNGELTIPKAADGDHVLLSGNALKGQSSVANFKPTGVAESAPFVIERDFLNFSMNGARTWPDIIGVQLWVDGKLARAACGRYDRPGMRGDLFPTSWDVREFAGKKAHVRVVDATDGGCVAADAFVQSDTPTGPVVDASVRFYESLRPGFHFTAPWGWIADPDGLIYYKGKWLMAYQYSYLINSAGRAWGHAISEDLIHWEHRPVALYADEYGQNLSGAGAVDWNNDSGLKTGADAPLLMTYTLQPSGYAAASGKGVRRSGAALAYSTDGGLTWQKDAQRPLFEPKDNTDRDPKILRDPRTGDWIVILCHSANNVKAKSAYGFYRSKDLKHWELMKEVPDLWENPDLFQLPLDGEKTRMKWVLVRAGTEYFIGDFDGTQFTPQSPNLKAHWARHLYGAQTFSDAPDGRRVQMAWMNTGKLTEVDYPGMPFDQQMTFPVELTLRSTPEGERLFFWPVKEIEALRERAFAMPALAVDNGQQILDLPKTELWDVSVEIELGTAKQVGLDIRGMRLTYDVASQTLTGPSGEMFVNPLSSKPAPLKPMDGKIRLRVLLDRTSLEVFGNDGLIRMCYVAYPKRENKDIGVWSAGGRAVFDMTAWSLKPAVPKADAFEVKF